MPREKSKRQQYPQSQFRVEPALKKAFKLRCIELDKAMDEIVEGMIRAWLGLPHDLRCKCPQSRPAGGKTGPARGSVRAARQMPPNSTVG